VITADKGTLAYQLKGRPLRQKRSFGEVPASQVAQRLKAFLDADQNPNTPPETEAMWFYLTTHAVMEVQRRLDWHEHLGELQWVLDLYHKVNTPSAARAFYYLLLICTREARHLKNKAELQTKLVDQFGLPVYQYICSIDDNATTAMAQFPKKPPPSALGPYCEALAWIFYKGKWSGGYGGKKWGVIADCMNTFVLGKAGADVMLDTVWTLAHNTAPIFNKGMLYGHYSPVLPRILDVQHVGQIPQLIASDAAVQPYVPPELEAARARMEVLLGPSFGGLVDWHKVSSEAKSGQHYAKEKAKIKLTPAQIAEQKKAEEMAVLLAEAAAKKDHEAFLTLPSIGTLPGVKLKKIKLPRAA